ncbi:RNA recognition motif domain-containing protein [Oceanisphaera pacifica]|uniref:RNA-binding protein n=1 Tax=Oceanisphaera pacifica TaxID=2818389 RepID=A0ABS3NI82_9GAMM|nr:RNA-binding protein [Oceanisphaera pacifica]MBO1520296.1 RNA-binding protein [Oceanisphaera pacifica]
MKIMIRGLSRLTTEQQILALLAPYGLVHYFHLIMDPNTNNSKGFGFAFMPNPAQAKAAIKNLNGIEVDGQKIRVKKAEEKPNIAADNISETKKND